jgi:hypothetical protein
MRHLGANFFSQFKSKNLMNLFKKLCKQNQLWAAAGARLLQPAPVRQFRAADFLLYSIDGHARKYVQSTIVLFVTIIHSRNFNYKLCCIARHSQGPDVVYTWIHVDEW